MKPSVYRIEIAQGKDKYSWAAGIMDCSAEPPKTKTLMAKSLPELMANLIVQTVTYDAHKRTAENGAEPPLIVPAKDIPKPA